MARGEAERYRPASAYVHCGLLAFTGVKVAASVATGGVAIGALTGAASKRAPVSAATFLIILNPHLRECPDPLSRACRFLLKAQWR